MSGESHEGARAGRESIADDVPGIAADIPPMPMSNGISAVDLIRAFGLTPAQARVAALLARRRTNKEIARELGVSIHTVRRHVEAVLAKLAVASRRDVESCLG